MKTYTVAEIAEKLSTDHATVRRWINSKDLDATIESKKVGYKISQSQLDEFLAKEKGKKYATIAAATGLSAVAAVTATTPLLSTVPIVGLPISAPLILGSSALLKLILSKPKESRLSELNKQIENAQKELNDLEDQVAVLKSNLEILELYKKDLEPDSIDKA